MRRLITAIVSLVALVIPTTALADSVPFGKCGPLAFLTFPEPRVCQETQAWWMDKTKTGGVVPAVPGANFPTDSTHVHMMVPFPLGERLVIPSSGGYNWPYYAQWHNGPGGTVRQNRGGQWQLGPCCTKDPNYLSVPITSVDQNHVGSIPIPASEVSVWRTTTGKRENRFTSDTTSPFRGNRQYNSGAWNAWFNAISAPVAALARGWYPSTGYTNFVWKDSNIGTGTGFTATQLRDTCAPSSVTATYALVEGATHAFVYVDPNLHAGDKGTVVAENKTGSTGSVTFSTVGMSPGVHILMGGGWEKGTDGWNAGVMPLPFKVC